MSTGYKTTFRMPFTAVLVALYCGQAAAAQQTDLSRRYPATLDYREESNGFEWTCTPQDIWRVQGVQVCLGGRFRHPAWSVASRLRLSRNERGLGGGDSRQARPDREGQGGQGGTHHQHLDAISSGPRRRTVSRGDGPGPRQCEARSPALRLAAHKMIGCWQSGNLPMIPQRNAINIDMETREGCRRFYYSLDTESGTIRYSDAFRTRTVPPVKPLDSRTALAAFDKVWNAFDREYAMFAIKPRVDWPRLRETYRPQAAAAKTNQELATVLSGMLDHLQDLHVYVQVDGEYVPGYSRYRPLNANWKARATLIGRITSTGHDLDWGRTNDGIGYINIYSLSDAALPEVFDDVLGQMADTKGIILDLRFNGGGSEPLGCEIAGRFLDRRRLYSLSQFREGPKHSDLGPRQERACGPDGPWHYVGLVTVLQGRKTMSSAESFALALAQCPQVTTLGDCTAGSSGNPRQVETEGGIIVNLPRWIDMDPQGKPIDVVGVAPQVKIEARPNDFGGNRDPVLMAALDRLRTRLKTEKSPSGGVLQRRSGVLRPEERPKVISVFPAPNATGVDTLRGDPRSLRPSDGPEQDGTCGRSERYE